MKITGKGSEDTLFSINKGGGFESVVVSMDLSVENGGKQQIKNMCDELFETKIFLGDYK